MAAFDIGKKGHFFEKRAPKILPYSISFQNKALYNFCKRGQRSIVEQNIGLEHALLMALNSNILTTLSQPLRKNVNDPKSYVVAMRMIMFFKILKCSFSGKIRFFYLLAWGNEIPQTRKNDVFFSEILTHITLDFFHTKNDGLWLEFALFGR